MACGMLSEYTGILTLFYITAVIKLLIVVFNIPVYLLTKNK